jgi:hypothetical protein
MHPLKFQPVRDSYSISVTGVSNGFAVPVVIPKVCSPTQVGNGQRAQQDVELGSDIVVGDEDDEERNG